uniref:Uncharacterized protein n=1 Tax=Rhizophora mucronata TaxID=61149 RepID=A0A2P2PL84_RHIMU
MIVLIQSQNRLNSSLRSPKDP